MKIDIDEIIELPWKKTFVPILKKRGLNKLVAEGEISFSKKHNDFLLKNWSKISDLTLIDPFRMGVILDLVDDIKNVKGDVVECGTFKGGTGILIGLLFKQLGIKKEIHLFDSFEGLPSPHASKDGNYTQGEFKSDYDELKEMIAKHGLEDSLFVHKGWFNETVSSYTNKTENKIALLHIDCDLYTSTVDSYGPLQNRMNESGIVIFDDYNDGGKGEKRAVEELLTQKRKLYIGPAPQAYYYCNDTKNTSHSFNKSEVEYVFDELLANKEYLSWLNKVGKIDFVQTLKELGIYTK